MKNLITCLVVGLLSGATFATTWTVDDDGNADFDNIQAAVDAASDGDEILVMPGIYTSTGDEVVNMMGKVVWLHSSDGLGSTIIDGEGVRRGIHCYSGETAETIIEGLVVTNCTTGMRCNGSSPSVINCEFSNGFGVTISYCNSTFIGCMFVNNEGWEGSAASITRSASVFENCTFEGNTAERYGGAIYVHYGPNDGLPTFSNCTFASNSTWGSTAHPPGGAINNASNGVITITDSVFCNNSPDNLAKAWQGEGNCFAFSCDDSDADGTPDECGMVGDGVHLVPEEYSTIQEAVVAAGNGDEIIVSPGTYSGTDEWVINTMGKPLWIHSIDGPEVTVIDGENERCGILCGNGETTELVIDGFTVTNCVGSETYQWWGSGGGIRCIFSSPSISGCFFTSNSADSGGALLLQYSNAIVSDCTFTNNTTVGTGGGIDCIGKSSPLLSNCYFTDNSADNGGGLSVYCWNGGNPILTDCLFESNSASGNGGAIFNGTGPGLVTVTNCTVSENHADGTGGGLYSEVDNIFINNTIFCGNTPNQANGNWNDDGSNCQVNSCQDSDGDGMPDQCGTVGDGVHHVPSEYMTIQAAIDAAGNGDEIVIGPGMYGSGGDSVINTLGKQLWIHSSDGPEFTIIDGAGLRRCIICENGESAVTIIEGLTITGGYADSGGGIYCNGSNPTIIDCVITGNSANLGGGICIQDGSPAITGCVFSENAADGGGGGFFIAGGEPYFTSCTVSANLSEYGEAGYVTVSEANDGLRPTFKNCSFSNHSGIEPDWNGSLYIDQIAVLLDECALSLTSIVINLENVFTQNAEFSKCTFVNESVVYAHWYPGGNRKLILTECIFTGLDRAITSECSAVDVIDCAFSDNVNALKSYGDFCNKEFNLTNCSFSNHSGPAIDAHNGRWTVTDCNFEDNVKAINQSWCDFDIAGSYFSGNEVGAISESSDGDNDGGPYHLKIKDSLFCSNGQPDIVSTVEWEDLGGNGFFVTCDDNGSDGLPRYWNNPIGGFFSDASNWWFPTMPGEDNDAIFDLESQYTINFSQDISTLSAIYTGGDVTFDLGGFEYENVTSNDPGLVVGDFGIGSSASLTIENGSMFCFDAMLGRNSGAQGLLTLAGEDASLQTQSKLWVGFEGIGSLQLTDGAQLITTSATIGGGPGSSGSAVLSGSNTLWYSPFLLEISRGYVDVQEEAEVQVGFLAMIYQGGEIRGDGVISSDVVNFGLVHPDMSTQPLRFNGDYEQVGQIAGIGSGTGLLQSTIGPASHGKLQVNGDAVIGGGVAVEIDEGFWEPGLGETFTLLSADSIDGHFDVALLPDLSGDKSFVIEYGDGTSVDLAVTGATGGTGFGDPLDTSIDGAASASTTGDFNNDGLADIAIALSGEGYWSTGGGIRGGGSTLTFGDHSIDANGEGWVNLMWQSDSYIAGFQIHLEGATVISMEDGLVEQYGWDMWQVGGDVVCWAGIGVNHIPPQNSPVHLLKLHITGADNMLSFEGVLFGDDNQSALVVDSSHTLYEVEATGNLLVLINDGLGGFLEPAQQLEIDSNPQSITLGDFNGDNAIDMAIACADSNTVSIVENLGLGDGQFYLAWSIATGSNPRGITVTHANDDDVIDLAVVCSGDDALQFLINESNGTFSDGGSVAVGENPQSVQHGDDYNTLVVANTGENSVSLLQKASGNSWNVETYEVGDNPTEVVVSDLNLDGYDDAIVANYVDGTVTVLLSDGNGFNSQATLPIGDLPSSIASGDFDDDGDFDIAMITGSGAEDRVINILRNDINLTGGEDLIFASAQELAAGENPLFLNSGDIDGDGVVDLVTVSGLIGFPGFRGSETSIVSSRHWGESSPCTGDFDADGDVDVADLLTLIAAWGNCHGCPADFDGDNDVDVADLLTLIAAWGPCE